MQHTIRPQKKVTLEIQLDGSETVMFNEGGKHTLNIKGKDLFPMNDATQFDLEIVIQATKNAQRYYKTLGN